MHQNHLECLLSTNAGPYLLLSPRWGFRVYMSNKFPGDAEAAGLETTLWEPLIYINLGIIDIWGQIILVVRGCPVCCSSICGLYPLDAITTSLTHNNQNVCRYYYQMSYGGGEEIVHCEPQI